MKLSVVVTTKNRRDALLRCVESLRRSTYTGWELVVIDDCSTDGTRDLTPESLGVPGCRVLHADRPLMMVKARNLGAREAKGAYVLFVDDDNVVDDRMLAELVGAADRHPDYGILGPAMFYLATRRKYLDYQRINLFTSRTAGLLDSGESALCDSDGIPNVFLVRRSVFDVCGGFDEAMAQTYTEPDFALTARRHGFRCGVVKAAKTYHDVPDHRRLSPRDLGGNFLQKAYCLMRNRSVIVRRHGAWYHRAAYGACFSWVWPLAYTLLVVPYRRFDLVRLYWYGYRDGMVYLLTGRLPSSLGRLLG